MTFTSAWVGVPSATEVPVSVRTTTGPVRLKVATNEALTTGVAFTASKTPGADGDTLHVISGLAGGTTYWAQVEENGALVGPVMKCRTAFTTSRTVKIVAASCDDQSIGSSAVNAMAASGADIAFHLGDLTYNDNAAPTRANFRNQYNDKTRQAGYRSWMTSMPVLFTRSDHDLLANDRTGGTFPEMGLANEVYREKVPVLPSMYALSGATDAPYYSFYLTPRIMVINTDGRTFMSNATATDNASKTVLGATQKQWFKNQLTATTAVLVIWVQADVGWIGGKIVNEDDWRAYTTERTELGNFIAQWKASTGKVLDMFSGDMHALAVSDGSNSPGGVPVFHCAPIHNEAEAAEGGPFTRGPAPALPFSGKAEQYGEVVYEDLGTSMRRTFRGLAGSGTVRIQPLTITSAVPGSAPPPPPPPPDPGGTGGATVLFSNPLSGPAGQAVTVDNLDDNGGGAVTSTLVEVGASMTYSSDGQKVLIASGGGSNAAWIQKDITLTDEGVVYLGLQRGSIPATNLFLIRFNAGGALVARLSINTSGIAVLHSATNSVWTGTVPIALDRRTVHGFRIKLSADPAVGQLEYKRWEATSAAPDTTPDVTGTPVETGMVSLATGSTVGAVRVGNTGGNNNGNSNFFGWEITDRWKTSAAAAVSAGPDKTVTAGSAVTITAVGSPSGGTFAWTRNGGTAGAITTTGSGTATLSYTAPSSASTAIWRVTYTAPGGAVTTDDVVVTHALGARPVVIASRKDLVVIDASPTLVDTRIEQTSGEAADVTESPADVYTIDMGSVTGEAFFAVIANDGTQDSEPLEIRASAMGTTQYLSTERYYDPATRTWRPEKAVPATAAAGDAGLDVATLA